jgi:hypothetical protein
MSPTQRVRQSRIYLTLVVAAGHLALMVLGLVNRLSFSVPTRYSLLEQTLDNSLWTILQGACFVAIIIALKLKKGMVPALSAATGVMAAWSFLNLLWGFSTPTAVSLAGPVLGGGMATLAYMLTISWARSPKSREKGE